MPDSVAELIADSPLAKSVTKRFEDLPGWSYLGFVFAVAAIWVPKTVRVFDTEREVVPVVVTVGVFGATYVFYFAGDWFDDHFWKRRRHRRSAREDRFTDAWTRLLARRPGWRAFWWSLGALHGVDATRGPRALTQEWMGVSAGSYKTALSIARSADESLAYGLWWPNEVAKTSRSFILPLGATALIAAMIGHFWIALGALALAVFAIRLYVTLKFAHVRRLYVAVNQCRQEGMVRYGDHRLVDDRDYRIFIVDRSHVVAKALR